MNLKQAVILAGGKGTRLQERLRGLPKPMVDFCGHPLLERQILLLKRYGYKEVIILVNHKAEKILQFCQLRKNWGMEITCLDDGEPKGTAGAVLHILDCLDEEFLVVYGDTMLEINLPHFEAFHQKNINSAATLLLHPNDHPYDSDLVDVNINGHITAFHSYPHKEGEYYPNLVNAALYIIRKRSMMLWKNHSDEVIDFAKHLFPQMLEKGLQLSGYNSPEYIKDCGTPERLDKVIRDFKSGKISRSSLELPQAAVFLDRDGTINCEVNHLNNVHQFDLLPGVENAIHRINNSEYRCCVITNQPVIARGDCSQQELGMIHNKMETLLGKQGAFLDRIYFCPHHPDKGFSGEIESLKINCGCRKPNTGLIDSACVDLNVDKKLSWFIGDSTTDIETARRAGLRSILVETGYAGLDSKYNVIPDYIVPDLFSAVEFILNFHPKALKKAENWVSKVRAGETIMIGGLSRSGKSTAASVFKDALANNDINAVIISTDRWLLPVLEREPNVFGRHDINALQAVIDLISENSRPLVLELPAYVKKTQEQVKYVEKVTLSPDDVVIIEGIVSLSLEAPEIKHRFVIELDEIERKERVLNEYRLRSLDSFQALSVYEGRQEDEIPYLLPTFTGATKIKSFNKLKQPNKVDGDAAK